MVDRVTVEVAGVRSPVLQAGPSDAGEAVVFVHGNPGSGEDWRDLLSATGTFARSIAPDMPGYGDADKPARFEYTTAGYAAHLGAMLDQIGVRRAHLVLHDFGAAWGLSWAADHPHAVASVLLINGGVPVRYQWHYLARLWRTPLVGEAIMAMTSRIGFRTLIRRDNPDLPIDFIDGMYQNLTPDTKRAVLALYRATDLEADTAELVPRLRGITAPVMVLWGRDDPYLPHGLAQRQREVFLDAEVVLLDNSGHWPFADRPDETRELVVGFLKGAVTPTR